MHHPSTHARVGFALCVIFIGSCALERAPIVPAGASGSGAVPAPITGQIGSANTGAPTAPGTSPDEPGAGAPARSGIDPSADCTDADGDGFGVGPECVETDCADDDAHVHPAASEQCNARDDDCDHVTDEQPNDCGNGQHCAAGLCVVDTLNGEPCDAPIDCASGHCNGGLCCDSDVCCASAQDCGGGGTVTLCEDLKNCQGSRGQAVCEDNRCRVVGGTPDDRGCSAIVEADACGLFVGSLCNGELEQSGPRCITACISDSQCDPDAHCSRFRCVADLPDGASCNANSSCTSGHCQNGFCCQDGDCCDVAGDCPLGYWGVGRCIDRLSCQGTWDVAACEDSRCATRQDAEDDSACSRLLITDSCGAYADARCSGAPEQSAPVCATTCATSQACDPAAHCSAGVCVPDKTPGSSCTADDQCQTGHCQNGYCCGSGDCCTSATQCPGYTAAGQRTCVDSASCGGQRTDIVCASFQCQPVVTNDAAACNGSTRACGRFADAACPATCRTTCSSNSDCDPGSPCVDGVCCESACSGACEACNGAGQCAPVPAGQDPASECGAVACAGYYHGFSGASCFARADAGATAVACNGARACQNAVALCPSQPAGASVLECPAETCLQAAAGTCTGMTPGQCQVIPSCLESASRSNQSQ